MSESPPWHKEACAEASDNHDVAILANTGGEKAGSHAARAVLANLDRLWTNGVVRLLHFHQKNFSIDVAHGNRRYLTVLWK